MLQTSGLIDLHRANPAPSTYIGADGRRIDFMLGCRKIAESTIRAGTLSYIEGPQSDHRGLYIDLDSTLLLAHHPQDNAIQPPLGRTLKTGNPEAVTMYLSKMDEYYIRHNMVQRIQKLYQHHHKLTDAQLRLRLEKWDSDQGRAMRYAEKALGKRHQKHYWSPTLRNAGILCRYWHQRIQGIRHSRDTYPLINRMQRQIQQHDPTFTFPFQHSDVTIQTALKYWKLAKKDLKQCQANARDLRHQSYEYLLESYELDPSPDNIRKTKIVKNTIRTEKCREMFRQIKLASKPFQEHTGGLKSIMIPKQAETPNNTREDPAALPNATDDIYTHLIRHPDGPIEWETVIDRTDIEEHLLRYNKSSFRAASSSPCGHGIIMDALTFSTLSPAGTDVLRGIIPDEWHDNNQLLKEFLISFSTPTHIANSAPIPTSISKDDVKKGFGQWKEATSTSPSGRHLGHYKAIIQNPVLLECLTKFLSIAIARGLSIRRWQHAINIMLEKDPGRPMINRLRIIHLFEADFNFFLKLMWGSRLVHRAKDCNLINTGQYGSVPGKMAIELVMLNQISNDICRTQKLNIIRFENDASACYDRILVHLGMLAARRCGMPTNAIQIHADTLEGMQYRVKTAFGISNHHYTSEHGKPLFGTGQGSGASPAVWLTLVVILMNTLDRITRERIRFRSPDSTMRHQRLIDAFVDDTSLAFNDNGNQMGYDEMITKMEKIAQTWETLLAFSGGALNLKKCSWSMIFWEWKNGRPHQRLHTTDDSLITIQTKHQGQLPTSSQIRYTAPTESIRILGVHLNPNGNFTKQIMVLKEKSDQMANILRSSKITPQNMQTFLRTTYGPAMLYALPAVAADEESLQRVQTTMLAVAMQKLGASKATSQAIRHGPYEYGGINVIDLRTELGISTLKFFRQAIYSGSEAGKLLLISLKYSQIEGGIPEHLLERPDIHLSYLTPTWLTSMRQFMYQHNITVTITDTLTIIYSGKYDQCIMDTPTLRHYSPQQQRDINLVRLHLQAITLSDLSTPDGTQIRPHALRGVREVSQRPRQNWPRQEPPTASQQRLWQRYMKSNFIRYDRFWRHELGPAIPNRRPRTPLAPFLAPHMIDTLRGQSPPAQDLKTYISRLPNWHRRLLSHYRQDATDGVVWKAFRSRSRVTIASDGGLKHRIGTHGWKIVDRSGNTLFSGSGPVDGPLDIANSTRSELGGLTAPMLLCASLARYWGLSHRCRYIWLTDSKAAISKVTFVLRSSAQPHRYPDDVDFVTAIRALYHTLGRKHFKCKWVKGHQDDRMDYDDLPTAAKLNIDVDALASEYFWSDHGRKPTSNIPHFPEYKITLSINGVRFPSKIDQQIRFHINGSYLKQQLQQQHRWNEKIWYLVDFEAFGRHFKKLPIHKQIQHMKFVHDIQPIGSHHAKLDHAVDVTVVNIQTQCPCCRTQLETQTHMLHCQAHPRRRQILIDFAKQCKRRDGKWFLPIFADLIGQWMTASHLIPTFDKCRDTFLRHDIIPIEYSQLVQQVISEQTAIGWIHAVRGFLSKSWHTLASCLYNRDSGHVYHKHDGGHQIQHALKALHFLTTEIWAGRNEALHRHQQAATTLQQNLVNATITRYHSEPDLLLHDDTHYCTQSLERLLRSSSSHKRRWLHRVKASRLRKAYLLTRQPRITKHFKTISAPLAPEEHQTVNNIPVPITHTPSVRNVTVQRLMTFYFRERAPNQQPAVTPSSPPPQHNSA